MYSIKKNLESYLKLSIFSKAKHLPSKEEKGREARFTSKPYLPEVVEFVTHQDLIDIICSKVWSPSIFEEYRRQDGFISTDLMVLDIDSGMTIEEAEKVVHRLDVIALCLPTTSHSEEAHRFRLIFPLSKTITKEDSFKSTMEKLAEVFPADPACIGDTGRFYFGSTMDDGFWYSHGKLLDPVVPKKVKKATVERYNSREAVIVGDSIEELVVALFKEKRDFIPDCIAYFLENVHTGLHGEFHNAANSFLFTCSLMGCKLEDIEEVFREVCPEELDQHDEYLLNRATQDGYRAREEDEV